MLEVMSNGRGLFLLWIADRDFRRKILEGSTVTFARIPLILQQWKPGIELNKDSLQSVPVWVRLKNLPFSFWSAHSIGKVASALEKPLYVDEKTEQMAMLTFARVCVEITVQQPIYETIQLVTMGKSVVVDVEYEWKPMACLKCGIFGHKCKVSDKESVPIQSDDGTKDAEPV